MAWALTTSVAGCTLEHPLGSEDLGVMALWTHVPSYTRGVGGREDKEAKAAEKEEDNH